MDYNQIYKNQAVWGSEPNGLLLKIIDQINPGTCFLDLGCGQGRDSLFMLQHNFQVTAVDKSSTGLKSIVDFIELNQLPLAKIKLLCQDIANFDIENNKYTVINIFNSLQFLLKSDALRLIKKSQSALLKTGYIVISGFTVDDLFFKEAINKNRCFFESQELKKLFSNFKIVFYKEENILDKGHVGDLQPHQHGLVKIIAQK